MELGCITISSNCLSVDISPFGGTITAVRVGKLELDVALGYQSKEQLLASTAYLGSTVGRCANRIAKGKFSLNGKDYCLACNNGENHLHGGCVGWDRRQWDVVSRSDSQLVLGINSTNGEEGYPGNMTATVTYLVDSDKLTISYSAVSDEDTLCNLTNHMYVNLNGHDSGTILDHQLTIYADSYMPIDSTSIPLGISQVSGSVFDFRQPKAISQLVESQDNQALLAGGLDHNYCVSGGLVAKLHSPVTNISMLVYSDRCGLQVYSGNYLQDTAGKSLYAKHGGIALETQCYPDNINNGLGDSVILRANEKYASTTSYQFVVGGEK